MPEQETAYTCHLCYGYLTDDEGADAGSVARGHQGSDEDNTLEDYAPGYGLLQRVEEFDGDAAKQDGGVAYGMAGVLDPGGLLGLFGASAGGGGAAGAAAGATEGLSIDSGIAGAISGAVSGAFF